MWCGGDGSVRAEADGPYAVIASGSEHASMSPEILPAIGFTAFSGRFRAVSGLEFLVTAGDLSPQRAGHTPGALI
jgi:hypothetical protein